MGDHNENSGQAGAVGRNNKVSSNTFVQGSGAEAVQRHPLSPDDLDTLKLLVSKLLAAADNVALSNELKLGDDDAAEAGVQLKKIAKAYDSGEEETKIKAVENWRHWLSTKGDEVVSGITTAAQVVAVALPALHLLGIAA